MVLSTVKCSTFQKSRVKNESECSHPITLCSQTPAFNPSPLQEEKQAGQGRQDAGALPSAYGALPHTQNHQG